jgi:hypothetical protein
VKSNKNNWITLLTVLLVVLQPAISFGNDFSLASTSENHQTEIGYFKTKNTKAILLEEITINTAEHTVLFVALKNPCKFFSNPIPKTHEFLVKEIFLVDLRSILSAQIFPFHSFL